MKYVLDANVALRTVLNEPHSDKARKLIDDYRAGVHELLAPDFFPLEVANALTRAERKRIIPQGQAGILLAKILVSGPELHEANLTRAVDMASQARASVYDCLYYVLAEDNGCPFVTADRKILNAFPHGNILDLATF